MQLACFVIWFSSENIYVLKLGVYEADTNCQGPAERRMEPKFIEHQLLLGCIHRTTPIKLIFTKTLRGSFRDEYIEVL